MCRPREGAVMAGRVFLTVVLFPTESFGSPTTNCRCCQTAYFPNLHRLGECICVTLLLTESRARARESVCIICTSMEIQFASQYFIYTPSHVDMCLDFFIYCVLYTRITSHEYSLLLHVYAIDVCSMDELLHGKETTHTFHVCTCTD